MNTKNLVLTFLCLLAPLWARAQEDPISRQTMLIDVPTAEVFDRYQASFLTRAYSHGTVMESIDFGVYSRINIGLSIAAHELLGSSSDVKVLDPSFQAKWKIFDGNLYLPAIAIGYDGRRYGYGYVNHEYTYDKKHNKEFMDNRKGGYIALSREIITPGLGATFGVNLSDWDASNLYIFTGLYYTIAETIGLMVEWDSIRNTRDSRLNAGMRFYLHPSLALDAAVRRIGRGDESERILQFRYVTNF